MHGCVRLITARRVVEVHQQATGTLSGISTSSLVKRKSSRTPRNCSTDRRHDITPSKIEGSRILLCDYDNFFNFSGEFLAIIEACKSTRDFIFLMLQADLPHSHGHTRTHTYARARAIYYGVSRSRARDHILDPADRPDSGQRVNSII